ncbi:amino acid ABC transporter ATP-binding/permease protein [Macrococcus brunensis]|uniref:amino acid ABC transporter ATP-binding/permease protein n=1 Tax=Macrococcus brunensis TaxID=198483 RepID=UPI001EF045E0|nr:ATP-binding cassette domain-containing protein [Macrococcus brunensis]ULG72484.1 ATP-binding cassette domain-containing protein [Macrococcus brunensis]
MFKWIDKQTYRSLSLAILIGVIGGLTAIGMFSLSGLMLSKSAYGVPLYSLMILVASIKLLGVVRAVARYFERLISHDATFRMLKEVRVSAFDQLMLDFVNLHQKWRLSELLQRTVNDIEKLQNVLLRVIYPPVVVLLTALNVCVIYAFYDWQAVGVIAGVMLIILGVLPLVFSRMLSGLTNRTRSSQTDFMDTLADFNLGREDLAVFDQQGHYAQRLLTAQHEFEKNLLREKQLIAIYDWLLNLFSMLAIWGVLYVMLDRTVLMYASIVMVTITLFEMAIPMTNFPFYYQETKRASEHLLTFSAPEDQIRPAHVLPIELKNLHFIYPGQVRPVLNDLTMTIREGEKIAIVGSSGSGKSTLMSLLSGLYSSDMLADGLSMQDIDRESYMNELNVMQQKNHFFQGTVQDNLFSQNTEAINQYLEAFHLPFSADSAISEFGRNLSGGERQRLHFIRLLLRDRPLWLLDEPFNGIDVVNRQLMIEQILKQNTVVVISHELEILQDFDMIYVLEDGKLMESGHFESLMERRGIFYQNVLLERQRIN